FNGEAAQLAGVETCNARSPGIGKAAARKRACAREVIGYDTVELVEILKCRRKVWYAELWRGAVVCAMRTLLGTHHPVPLAWVMPAQRKVFALRWRGCVVAPGVDHEHLEARFDQREGRRDAGGARANDDDVERHSTNRSAIGNGRQRPRRRLPIKPA